MYQYHTSYTDLQALRSKPELAHIGLRTLEFWVDNLNVVRLTRRNDGDGSTSDSQNRPSACF